METIKNFFSVLSVLLLSLLLYNCTNDDNSSNYYLTPSQVLASTAWETTNAKNETGVNVPLTDPNVINFVGFAYYDNNGTFTMYNLDDSPKMRGDWVVSPDGKTRTIAAKNSSGEVLFTRVVDITVLTKDEFTYRIYPNENDKSKYFDIIHTPTTHKEPTVLTPSQVLASTAWETTNAKNETGVNVPLTDPNVINFVGFAYYDNNGTFTMYNLDDSPKMQGDWMVSPDGKTRTITAKNSSGEVLFTRVVDITVLTNNEFTYRIFPNENDKSKYFDIIHTPTTHKEPTVLTPSQVLASTAWETTNAKNETGVNVPLTDSNVINFVGFAYYDNNGTFTMYNLDDSPKMRGDWVVSPDGKTRTITAKNSSGEVLFTRVVDITVLTKDEFTYRIYPNENDKSVYFDIIHTPTNHVEP